MTVKSVPYTPHYGPRKRLVTTTAALFVHGWGKGSTIPSEQLTGEQNKAYEIVKVGKTWWETKPNERTKMTEIFVCECPA